MYIIVKTIKSSIITHDFIITIELIYLSAYKLIHVAISLAYSPKDFRFVDFLQQLNGPPTFLQEDQFANEEPEPEARFLGFCCVFLKGPGLNWLQ